MPANSTLDLVSLDFDDQKASWINYLQTQTIYKDAAANGSNINVLNDLLSMNSTKMAFYLNMVTTEMWNDTAQKLDSVVSHAKELNYTPLSYKSSTANVSFTVTSNNILSPLTIPKGCYFSGQNANGTYGFTTDRSYIFTSPNSTFVIANVQIYEGNYTNDVFIIDSTQDSQQFVLSNPNIDTDSLTITVSENSVNSIFTIATTLYNLNSNSNVYFLQGAQNGKYEILFGDNIFGRYPINSALITASYRTCNGTDCNGISKFSLYTNLGSYNGAGSTTNSPVSVYTSTVGGANSQNIESIRFYAPRYFAAQERAVAADDYSSLVLANFGGEISDVATYGGELLNPKKYGTTVLCLKPTIGNIVPNYVKNKISNFFINLNKLPKNTFLTDPDYFYCSINTVIDYDSTLTTSAANDVENDVLKNMLSFFKQNVESFNNNFRYSKFVASIDNTDNSIISNDTQVSMIKRITPLVNINQSYIINYNNPAYQITYDYMLTSIPPAENKPTFYSSPFTYSFNSVFYPNSIIRDDGYGKLVILNSVNNIVSEINNNIGSINYQTGQVQINNITISQFVGSYISLYFTLQNTDILVSQNQILEIDPADVNINVVDINSQ